MNIDLAGAKVGDKVKFAEEATTYTIQARTDRFLVCTRPFNPKRTVIYAIVDIKRQVRGPDNMVFSNGYESRVDCESRLAELENGEIEVSWRKSIRLEVATLIPHLIKTGARYFGRDGASIKVSAVGETVHYHGDADGFAREDEFRRAYVGLPRFIDEATA